MQGPPVRGISQGMSAMTTEPQEALTLLSVGYYSWNYMRFLAFTASRLAESGWKEWLIMDNTPGEAEAALLRTLPGARVLPQALAEPSVRKAPYYKSGLWKNDYSCAVNVLYKEVKTKYTLLIDPDVALLRRGWDRALVDEMERQGYDAIGAPYHPRKWRNYTGYPCVIFLLIRTELLQESNLDFCAYSNNPLSSRWDLLLQKRYPYFLNRFTWRLTAPMVQGTSQDAGWRLPHLFRARHAKTKTFDIPFIRDVDYNFPGSLQRVKPTNIFRRPDRGLFESADFFDTEYEEFWHAGALLATHRGRSSPRDAEVFQHLARQGRWAPGKAELWFTKVLEYTGLSVEEFGDYAATAAMPSGTSS